MIYKQYGKTCDLNFLEVTVPDYHYIIRSLFGGDELDVEIIFRMFFVKKRKQIKMYITTPKKNALRDKRIDR